uniref:Uncharacterized protein n=1 Tax=Parascaris univalens TaxID=6257 RepID=A0A915B9D7_PARUN
MNLQMKVYDLYRLLLIRFNSGYPTEFDEMRTNPYYRTFEKRVEIDEEREIPFSGGALPFSGGLYGKTSTVPFHGGIYGKRAATLPFSGGFYGKRAGWIPFSGGLYGKRTLTPFQGGIYGKRAVIPLSGGLYGKRASQDFTKQNRLSLRSIPMSGGFFG